MHSITALVTILLYFLLLLFISKLTTRKLSASSFVTADNKAPWYVVSFGMIGAALSGVTFIAVPGSVSASGFKYFQLVLGNGVGYVLIGLILIPLYYRLKLSSIYVYLQKRFGDVTHKTGASFFIVSQLIGASFRLYLVILIFHQLFFKSLNLPFFASTAMILSLIWLYTRKGGMKTIVWTDTLQTSFMLISALASIYFLIDSLDVSFLGAVEKIFDQQKSISFEWDWRNARFFWKEFIAGIFLTIATNGLDQNMMQKNLTCKSPRDAKKNMFLFSFIFVISSILFLSLGAFLYFFANENGLVLPDRADLVFPTIALEHLPSVVGVLFVLGLSAAAYSSADSSLTSLTSSFFIDILREKSENTKLRKLSHIAFTSLMFFVIVGFYYLNNESVILAIFKIAGFTYGPLLGLFVFGILSKRNIMDGYSPYVCLLACGFSYLINRFSPVLFSGYQVGFEILLVNAFLTILGLFLISKKPSS